MAINRLRLDFSLETAEERKRFLDVYTKPDEYSEVILTEETAEDPKKYILKPKKSL